MEILIKALRVLTLTVSAVLTWGGTSYAQHSFTPDDIANGGQLYRTNCLGCHGPSGDTISNAPVMTGKFRRGNSDEDLTKLIRNGISGTAMTAQPSLSENQALNIVGFLRSVATTAPTSNTATAALPAGDATRGKGIFEGKGNCLSCHRVGGNGSLFGPDLSGIGNPPIGRGGGGGGRGGAAPPAATAVPPVPAGPNMAQLQQSLVDPNAVVSNTNRYVQITMRDGSATVAKLLNQDTYAVQVLDFKEKLQSISRNNIKSLEFKSPMPSYRDKLTSQELADVLSYLATLKGQTN
jgi:cytochrome c oxidase cbb3-type subunit III